MKLTALDQPTAPPLDLPAKFRTEIVFFITLDPPPPLPLGEGRGEGSASPRPLGEGQGEGAFAPPKLGENEYWINLQDAQRWLDDGCLYVVSPLDAQNKAQIELTEDHELFLEWLLRHQIQHVRIGP